MPLANHTQKTCPAWLDVDAELPEAERPIFHCRFLSKFEIDTYEQELAAIRKAESYEAAHERLSKLLARGIVGWERQTERADDGTTAPIAFAPDRFDRILTAPEKFELARLMLDRPRITEMEKKSSSSRPPSPGGSSAQAAPEEPAAKTTP